MIPGCYYNVLIQNAFIIAGNRCKQADNGYMAVVQDQAKQTFLNNSKRLLQIYSDSTLSLVIPDNNFWIGLKYDGQKFIWSDPNSTVVSFSFSI